MSYQASSSTGSHHHSDHITKTYPQPSTSSSHTSSGPSTSSTSDPSSYATVPARIITAPRFEDADPQHLTQLIADMLERLIVHNDQIPLSPDSLTRFHSRSAPGISVLDYLQRIVRYANVERSCLLITLHYIDQICERLPKFTITSLTVHRFVIASVTVSSKALCDVFCTNSHYARVGGIKLNELNMLEREFLSIMDWRLACTRELLQQYYVNLVRTHSKGMFELGSEAVGEAVESGPPQIPPSLTHHGELDEEAAESCQASTTAEEDVDDTMSDGADSSSAGLSSDEEDGIGVETAPPTSVIQRTPRLSAGTPLTPHTAAKRAREIGFGIVLPSDERPTGRRRIDG